MSEPTSTEPPSTLAPSADPPIAEPPLAGSPVEEPPVTEDFVPLGEIGLQPVDGEPSADPVAEPPQDAGEGALGLEVLEVAEPDQGEVVYGAYEGDDHDHYWAQDEAEEREPAPGDAPGGDALPFPPPAADRRLLFVDVVLVLPSTNPVVVLQEADPPYRELRIPIGGAEGVAIAYAARQVRTPRPLTHELMARMLESFSLSLDVVRITESSGRTFRAEIVVSGPSGTRSIDCRPSDAVALALRQRLPVPIVAAPDVLDSAGGEAVGSN
jgi:bifunctional DNase/RNase